MMNTYTMEELLPVFNRLVPKYTSNDSTSITYETAQMLMGSILFTMKGALRQAEGGETAVYGGLSVWEAYEIGLKCRQEKVEAAKSLYMGIMKRFLPIHNEFYQDTLVKGMPAFFKHYDLKFHGQDTILTLDYPLHRIIKNKCGIDMIYEYLKIFEKEQDFLRQFSIETIEEVLRRYHKGYKGLVINVYEITVENLEYARFLEGSVLD